MPRSIAAPFGQTVTPRSSRSSFSWAGVVELNGRDPYPVGALHVHRPIVDEQALLRVALSGIQGQAIYLVVGPSDTQVALWSRATIKPLPNLTLWSRCSSRRGLKSSLRYLRGPKVRTLCGSIGLARVGARRQNH
jgi:hypothetical protein